MKTRMNGTSNPARCNLRNNAAVFAMDIDLRGDDVGEHLFSIPDYRRRRFIAGRFNTQNQHETSAVIFLLQNRQKSI